MRLFNLTFSSSKNVLDACYPLRRFHVDSLCALHPLNDEWIPPKYACTLAVNEKKWNIFVRFLMLCISFSLFSSSSSLLSVLFAKIFFSPISEIVCRIVYVSWTRQSKGRVSKLPPFHHFLFIFFRRKTTKCKPNVFRIKRVLFILTAHFCSTQKHQEKQNRTRNWCRQWCWQLSRPHSKSSSWNGNCESILHSLHRETVRLCIRKWLASNKIERGKMWRVKC